MKLNLRGRYFGIHRCPSDMIKGWDLWARVLKMTLRFGEPGWGPRLSDREKGGGNEEMVKGVAKRVKEMENTDELLI